MLKQSHTLSEKSSRNKKDNTRHFRISAASFAFGASAVLCALLLCAAASDCEKYTDSSVTAALTYTPPEKQEEWGFWEIFSDCIVGLFSLEPQ